MPEQQNNVIVVGVVTSLEDPKNLGRVCVSYPHLGDVESAWAWLVTPMAGPKRGMFFRPELHEAVLVAFAQGDTRTPYILGGVWNEPDKPPSDALSGSNKDNDIRMIQSRSGHKIILDDKSGSEKITITDKDGNQVVIDTANKKIQIKADGGTIEISAGAKGTIKLDAGTIEINSSGEMKLNATGSLTATGSTINLN